MTVSAPSAPTAVIATGAYTSASRGRGRGVTLWALDRADLTIATKLPGRHHGHDETIASAEASLTALGLDRIDLYLIHWPNPSVDRFVETWRSMIELRERGTVRCISCSRLPGLDSSQAKTSPSRCQYPAPKGPLMERLVGSST